MVAGFKQRTGFSSIMNYSFDIHLIMGCLMEFTCVGVPAQNVHELAARQLSSAQCPLSAEAQLQP